MSLLYFLIDFTFYFGLSYVVAKVNPGEVGRIEGCLAQRTARRNAHTLRNSSYLQQLITLSI